MIIIVIEYATPLVGFQEISTTKILLFDYILKSINCSYIVTLFMAVVKIYLIFLGIAIDGFRLIGAIRIQN